MPLRDADVLKLRHLGVASACTTTTAEAWIDTCCIIQDDSDDWKSEAGKMGAIFHHAYLTISAAGPNCHGGCGLSKVDPPALHFLLPDSASDAELPLDGKRNSKI